VRPRPARAPSTPAPASYSLFPPIRPLPVPPSLPVLPARPDRLVSSSSATLSEVSRPSSPTNDLPRLGASSFALVFFMTRKG
jgi:hypothetical protein